jgi:enamine deaminase RidA (YjgF/YER057c/UK114 family)
VGTNGGIAHRSFQGADGGTEHFLYVEAPAHLGFDHQIALVRKRYAAAQKSLGLAPETAVFRRLFLSDAMNQMARVRESPLALDPPESPVAVSIVQQPPLPGAKLALFAYHVAGVELAKRRLSARHVLVERNGLGHLWSTRLCSGAGDSSMSAAAQTRALFGDLVRTLAARGGTLRDHCVRTWVYLKDIDVFYQDMTDARRALFAEHGLTGATHYIASTGIEGACAHRHDLVALDAYSVLGLVPAQVSYLNDFDRLCPTKDYNVTFERGTRVAYADRAHLFISGTASIDRTGAVVHPGDALRQLDHTLANIEALLRSGAAGLGDLMHLLVYLRDPTDFARVDGYLARRFPGLPRLIVQGPVCRPEWLVEVEGIAITPNEAPGLPSF